MDIIQINEHRVRIGSIVNNIDDLMDGQIADIFYCDPPWGEGTIKAFETLAEKYGEGIKPHIRLNDFLLTLICLK